MKTAYWTQQTHLFRSDEFVCSNCGTSCGESKEYCPGCGARMKKGKYNASWVDEAEGLSAILDDDW